MKLKRLWAILCSYFPTALPVGMTEMVKWQDEVLALSKVPDNESTRFSTAVMILHLDPDVDRIPKRNMVKRLNKAASNECANAIALELKKKQQERMESEKALQQQASSDGPQGSQVS